MMMKQIFTQLIISALLMSFLSAKAQDSLFISELADPADDYSGRFVELFNAGNQAVDFSTAIYYLSRQSNGGTSWGDLQLTGIVEAGATYVIGGSGFEALYGKAPDLESGILIGNGDDAYALFSGGDHETGVLVDILGVIDVDGTGEAWEYEDSRALRVASVLRPNTVWTATEWEITSADVADCDPGSHNGSVVVDPPGDYSIALVGDTVNWGQPVEVPVRAGGLSAEDNIISYQFKVAFDPLVLEYSGFTLAGTMAEGGTAVVNSALAGELSVGYMSTIPLSGEGEILRLLFNALVLDTTEVFISDSYLNNFPVVNISDATVIVTETAPPTASIIYSDTLNRFADTLLITATFSEAMSVANAVLLCMDGAISRTNMEMTRLSETLYSFSFPIPKAGGEVSLSLSNGCDLWGNEVVALPTSGANFQIIPFIPGDVDDDGLVLAYDAALTLQYSVGMDPLPVVDPLPWENWRDSTANVDATGGISAHDAGLILQYSAGIISDFSGTSLKSASGATISMVVEDKHLVFYTFGDLLGFNLNTENKQGILGIPQLLNEEYMSAVNLSADSYRVGLCTAYPAAEGTPLMKIPLKKNGTVIFHMMVNTMEQAMKLDLFTGLAEEVSEPIKIFPNPVTKGLNISGLRGKVRMCIYSIHGQLLTSLVTEEFPGQIDVSDLIPGIYMLRLENDGKTVVRRFNKQ
jgi:Secretion system C-terminal sorting domain